MSPAIDAVVLRAVAPDPAERYADAASLALDLERLRQMLARAKRPFVLLGGGGWDRAACDALGEVLALDELHHQRRHAAALLEPVDRGDVRMVQRRQRPRLAREPLGQRRLGRGRGRGR